MKTRMVEERIGEACGPIDWDHPKAKGMPTDWREAEANPDRFRLITAGGMVARAILEIAMYDGWPYWRPMPAIHSMGPLGPEWTFFDSYGVYPGSVRRWRDAALLADDPAPPSTQRSAE